MTDILPHIVPILLITLLGWWLKRSGTITEEQWNGFEKVTYLVCFPSLIIHSLAKADLTTVPAAGAAASMVIAVVVIGGAVILARPLIQRLLGIDGPAFTSIFQGATRWNTFMAFGLAGSIYGQRGLTIVAVASAVIPPILNISSVMLLQRHASGKGGIAWGAILKNPFIWSSAVGLAINFSGIALPAPAMASLDYLGRAALGAAMLLIGSGLILTDLGKPGLDVWMPTILKLLGIPAVAAIAAHAFGIHGADLGAVMICAAMPCAGAAYILSRQMGGDHRLMAAIITAETVASAVTIPVILLLTAR